MVFELQATGCLRHNYQNATNRHLGASDYKWGDLYLAGTTYIGTYTQIYESGDSTYIKNTQGNPIFVDSSIRPLTNNAKDLGGSSLFWKDLYLKGNLTDGTNSIKVADIGKKLYQHNISSTGADFTNASLIIVTTSATPLTNILSIDLLLNGTSVVSAFIIDINGLYTPIIKYGLNGLTALDFNFVDVSGGALALGTKSFNSSDTITDTVTAL